MISKKVWVIVTLLVLCSISLGILMMIIDFIDFIADALSLGTVGVATGIIDSVATVIIESMQIGCNTIVMLLVSDSSWVIKLLKFIILTICGIIDSVLSVIGIFLPYFDTLEVIVTGITESIQMYILGTSITNYSLFDIFKGYSKGSLD